MDFSQYLGGLPLHPLIVHFAVVLVPLAALGLILLFAFRKWADKYGWLALLVLAVGTGAAFLARESGETLALSAGRPADHATWGNLLPFFGAGLFVLALIWLLVHKADRRADRQRSSATVAAGLLMTLAALATITLTVAVGHTGATAAWAGRAVPQPSASATPTTSATTTPVASPSASPSASASASPSASESPSGATYTMADVASHKDASSCWSAIDGSVYDLTDWISKHPGGSDKILSLCGMDGTNAFTGQHSAETRPEAELAKHRIGALR